MPLQQQIPYVPSLKALYQTSEVADVQGNDAAAAAIDDAQGWLVGAEYNLPTAKLGQ